MKRLLLDLIIFIIKLFHKYEHTHDCNICDRVYKLRELSKKLAEPIFVHLFILPFSSFLKFCFNEVKTWMETNLVSLKVQFTC